MLNKHKKEHQPLISSFFQSKTYLDNETKRANHFQIETKNRFTSLINIEFSNLSDLDNVVNLSDKVLTDQERNILNKGLNFGPTPGDPDMGEIRCDLDRYHRSLRIQCWLNKKPKTSPVDQTIGPFNDVKSLKVPSDSTWNPPPGPPNLEYIIASNETGLLLTKPRVKYTPTNITKTDAKCISDLATDTDIVIKKADKGGAVVIQNQEDYVREGERQLSDGKFYRKVDSDLTDSHNDKVRKQLDAMHK